MSNLILTDGEKRMLLLIANSEYRNDLLSEPVWSPCENNSDKGYLGSLVKKGLVFANQESVALTNKAIDLFTFSPLGNYVFTK